MEIKPLLITNRLCFLNAYYPVLFIRLVDLVHKWSLFVEECFTPFFCVKYVWYHSPYLNTILFPLSYCMFAAFVHFLLKNRAFKISSKFYLLVWFLPKMEKPPHSFSQQWLNQMFSDAQNSLCACTQLCGCASQWWHLCDPCTSTFMFPSKLTLLLMPSVSLTYFSGKHARLTHATQSIVSKWGIFLKHWFKNNSAGVPPSRCDLCAWWHFLLWFLWEPLHWKAHDHFSAWRGNTVS